MDIANWLESLGLERYLGAFRDAEIEADVLADLTESDLESLGLPLGPRRRILKAIAALGAHPPLADAAERRQLTVMFADLVGSTALSARLDPEDMRKVIRAYQDAVSGVVARYDGFVAKFMGDGVLAYFGFPRAHEDDATRAVHAGLEIAEIVAALKTPARETLAARIGVATGLVVVGDIVGDGPAREQAVVGDTPNLAARLQGLADAGGVVIAAATRRLVGETFVFREMGKHAVKGLPEPVEAFAALGVSGGESRFDAARGSRLAGFVGREAEAAELLARQRRAWEGRGQIALISGEAGIGKSRLSAWLFEQVADIPHTRLRYQCSPYHRDSALYPFARQFERAAGFEAREPPEAKLEKLEAVLGRATDRVPEIAPLIAAMLAIPTGGRYPAQNLSPAQQRRQTLFALLDQLEGLATRQPVLMLFEDAHWADATSLEALDLAIERIRKLPVLLIVTHRPEFEPSWKGLPDVAEIALQKLDRSEAENLVSRVARGRELPPDALAQILDKTDGVPLFVEELTKTVLESGLLSEGAERSRFDGPPPPLAIPSTLRDSLMARLDRLADAKEIAQIGAAIGREFSYALLRAVVDRDEPTILAALRRLEQSELVFRSGEPPAARYAFKHALVRDAAYESLLKSRRQILHRKIAERLRENFPEIVEAEPESLAHHFTQAGLTELGIEYWGKAGDLALRRSAFKEAIAHLGKAIEMTEAGGGEKAGGGNVKLHVSLGAALISAQGPGALETTATFERAHEIASKGQDTGEQLAVTYGRWAGFIMRGEKVALRELTEAFFDAAARRPRSAEHGVAHRMKGTAHWYFGEFEQARPHLDQALAIFDPERDRDLAVQSGQDAAVSAMFYLALTLWPLGEVDRARSAIDEMMARATRLDHAPTAVNASSYAVVFEVMRWDAARTDRLFERLVELAGKGDIPFMAHFQIAMVDGWRKCRSGDPESGLTTARRSLAAMRDQNVVFLDSFAASAIARAEAEASEFAAALERLDFALKESARTEHRWFDAELHRIRGAILLAQFPADPAPAEAAFLKAIEIARAQKARSFELRAALALAKLYHATGRDADAHAALGPALEGFSPTPEFPEIAEAKALFEALAHGETVRSETASRARQVQLQVALGNALLASRGQGARETTAAFTKAREVAKEIDDPLARAASTYGLWVGSYVRGELEPMKDLAQTLARETEAKPGSPEAAVAQRVCGVTRWFQGDYAGARAHYERSLAIFDGVRDRDLAFRFGQDQIVAAEILLALVLWPLGEVDEAARRAQSALRRAQDGGQAITLAYLHQWASAFEILREDRGRAKVHVEALQAISRDHDIALFVSVGALYAAWIEGCANGGGDRIRDRVAQLRGPRFGGGLLRLPGIDAAIAWDEAETRGGESAIAFLDEVHADNGRRGQLWLEAEDFRTRGEILARYDPAHAEAAFLKAIEIARAQKARSFELRAALALAKLYRSTGRDADARAALGSALEGFSPTPEFPEIAEAKGLLEALARDDAVRFSIEARKRRVDLQVSYGSALLFDRGHAAPETTSAFARARELATGMSGAESISTIYGLWIASYMRGELDAMRELAKAALDACASREDSAEACVAHRINCGTAWFAGEFVAARGHFGRALANFASDAELDVRLGVGQDGPVSAMVSGALVLWALGEFARARQFLDTAISRATALGHVPTLVLAHSMATLFEMIAGNPARARAHVEIYLPLARDNDMKMWLTAAVGIEAYLSWHFGDRSDALARFRRGVALWREQGFTLYNPLNDAILAEIEAASGEGASALATLDKALAESEPTGQRWYDAELHRARGEILLARAPDDPAAAEAAFLRAIEIARGQKARAFELRAALALAKRYRARGRDADAEAALAPALEGFSPTPEFPEIAEAMELLAPPADAADDTAEQCALLAGLWSGAHLRGELAKMREFADALTRLGQARPGSAAVGLARRETGATALFAGDFLEARRHLDAALDGEPDIIVGAAAWLARALWPLGEVDRARATLERALAGEVANVGTSAQVRFLATLFEWARRDFSAAEPHALALTRLARDHDLEPWKAFGLFLEGWLASRAGRRETALTRMRRGVETIDAKGVVADIGPIRAALAEAEAAAGDIDAALATLDAALAGSERTGQRAFDSELRRLRGEIGFSRDRRAAKADFLAAMTIARDQKAKSFELRAALSFAKLRRASGRDAEARDAIERALDGFTPTSALPEMAEALDLLGAMRAAG